MAHIDEWLLRCSFVQPDESFVELSVDHETQNAETVVHHLVRISLISGKPLVTEDLHVLIEVQLAQGSRVTGISLHHFLENQRLKKVSHVAGNEGLLKLLNLIPVFLVQPEAPVGIGGLLVLGLLFDLG